MLVTTFYPKMEEQWGLPYLTSWGPQTPGRNWLQAFSPLGLTLPVPTPPLQKYLPPSMILSQYKTNSISTVNKFHTFLIGIIRIFYLM